MSQPLLVLDLDETLWYGIKTPAGGDFQLRPYLAEFLAKAAKFYDFAIWTAASEDWMQAGLAVVAQETGIDLAGQSFFLWSQSRCTWRRTEDGEYDWRKPARKFKAGWIAKRYPKQRILVLDDRPENYAQGYGHLLKISSYTSQAADDELLILVTYLVSIAQQANLTAIEKRGWYSKTKNAPS